MEGGWKDGVVRMGFLLVTISAGGIDREYMHMVGIGQKFRRCVHLSV